jgi:hypothetical protein
VRRNISDEEITSENVLNVVGNIVEAIVPFVKSSFPESSNFGADIPHRLHT